MKYGHIIWLVAICTAVIFVCFGITKDIGKENDIITIDPNSELVRNLNLLYDPNFYEKEPIKIDKCTYISITLSDLRTNRKHLNVKEAAQLLRHSYSFDVNDCNQIIDFEVKINDETHTASFEDFFEWMGFKR